MTEVTHTRAHRVEDNLQSNWRRGNNSADWFANRGRELHYNIGNIVQNVKFLSDRMCEWARWLGSVTHLQYGDDFDGCDHDLSNKDSRQPKGKRQYVELPDEATVLRRFPWASRSLGTIEYAK